VLARTSSSAGESSSWVFLSRSPTDRRKKRDSFEWYRSGTGCQRLSSPAIAWPALANGFIDSKDGTSDESTFGNCVGRLDSYML